MSKILDPILGILLFIFIMGTIYWLISLDTKVDNLTSNNKLDQVYLESSMAANNKRFQFINKKLNEVESTLVLSTKNISDLNNDVIEIRERQGENGKLFGYLAKNLADSIMILEKKVDKLENRKVEVNVILEPTHKSETTCKDGDCKKQNSKIEQNDICFHPLLLEATQPLTILKAGQNDSRRSPQSSCGSEVKNEGCKTGKVYRVVRKGRSSSSQTGKVLFQGRFFRQTLPR